MPTLGPTPVPPPPVKCLRGTVNISAAGANTLGATHTAIPTVLYLRATGIGKQWTVAIEINGVWRMISVPTSDPDINYGKTYMSGEEPQLAAAINAQPGGIKVWIVNEIREWFQKLLHDFFEGLLGSSTSPPPATGPVTGATLVDAVNASLADDFMLVLNAEGYPEMKFRI